MSKRHIQTSETEAKSKIDQQIQKGQMLMEEGINILRNRPSLGNPTRLRDNFEVKYQQWEDFTTEILREVFVSGSYAYE